MLSLSSYLRREVIYFLLWDSNQWCCYVSQGGKFSHHCKRQIKGRVDRYEKIVVERIEMFHHY